MKTPHLLLIVSILLLVSCNQPVKTNVNEKLNRALDSEVDTVSSEALAVADLVFYNMFSPVDLDKILDIKSTYFNSNNLNSLNNLTKYTESSKVALNLGVYGADLSYLWIFEQTQQALSYLSAIQHMTNKLGIPAEFVDFTLSAAQERAHELDSLKSIARKAFKDTDRYLKVSDRENAAILILLGGWVESMYIALNMYNVPDPTLASRILTQKYSLNSLITMIQNHQDELKMSEYLLLLKKLNDSFSQFEGRLKPGDISIDTVNKRILINENSNINITPEDFAPMKMQLENIRKHIIN